jgi:hypothetical protein
MDRRLLILQTASNNGPLDKEFLVAIDGQIAKMVQSYSLGKLLYLNSTGNT